MEEQESLSPSNLFNVKGLNVVITGGGTGIGLMMTKAFALNGANKVFIVGRRAEKLEAAAKLSPNGSIVPIVGDVTSKESLQDIVTKVKEHVSHINVLCCNSGVKPALTLKDSSQVPITEFANFALNQDPALWTSAFDLNVTAVAYTAFSFLQLLDAGNRNRGPGGAQSSILVTSSQAAFVRGTYDNIPYSCSKSATNSLVKHLADKLIPYDIRCNAICPGLFPSDMSANIVASGGASQGDPAVEGAYSRSFIPSQRLGTTRDMAGSVLFLASAAGAYLNGCMLINDGGRMGVMPGTY